MHILLLGATGRTGTLILQDLLSRNHTITALVRNPSSLTPTPGLGIITGSPTDQSSISQAITSAHTPPDAVIIVLASVRASDSPFSTPTSPPRLMTDTHIAVLAAMKKYGIKRLITISAFGVGDSNKFVFWPMRMVLNYSAMKVAFADHNMVEEVVRREAGEWEREGMGLRWTLVRPCMLKEGVGKEVSVFGEQGRGLGLMPSASRESVARFVVERCLEKDEFIARTPVICD